LLIFAAWRMSSHTDILEIACHQPVLAGVMELLHEKEQQIPGSIHYSIKRYRKTTEALFDDVAVIDYQFSEKHQDNKLELKFCITGNRYCTKNPGECNFCNHGERSACPTKQESVDLINFAYTADHLSQFVKRKRSATFSESVLNFKHQTSFTKIVPLCSRTRQVLDELVNHDYTESLENIFVNAQAQMLLLYNLDCFIGDSEEEFSCKFLANDADRQKIIDAREILLQHLTEPLTIKELSRKVAINECYLKKGFKEMFGVAIFEFFQSQRMEHARYLLYEKGLSVTDVSLHLGYSSISHFSTAFKKHTGLKPCELLFRGYSQL
jgi:AraC family transcriptional regulator